VGIEGGVHILLTKKIVGTLIGISTLNLAVYCSEVGEADCRCWSIRSFCYVFLLLSFHLFPCPQLTANIIVSHFVRRGSIL